MVYKCKMCGGSIEVKEKVSVAQCPYCKETQTFPIVDDEMKKVLFDRANDLRLACDFDKAASVYEKLIEEGCDDSEAYWGLLLCKFGIEYVEDDTTHRRIPTCHRVQYDSILSDIDYQNAIKYADPYTQSVYEEQAKEIATKQKAILDKVHNEKPYDVFISFKATDRYGLTTKDQRLANGIYQKLTQENLRVFFSDVSLLDHVGEDYEPFIFAALQSAKVMLVVGTSAENMNAVWVRNEWGRFLKLCKNDPSRCLIACYRDMNASDLPVELLSMEAANMDNVAFLDPIIAKIKKLTQKGKTAVIPRPVKGVDSLNMAEKLLGSNVNSLVKKAFVYLKNGDFNSAGKYCDVILDQDSHCAEAYLGKLMVELRIKEQDDLANCGMPFDNNLYYQNVMKYGNDELKDELKGYNTYIRDRNEDYCKREIYNNAVKLIETEKYDEAINTFEQIISYKDVKGQISFCERKIEEIKEKDEKERLKAEEAEKKRKQRAIPCILISIVIEVVLLFISSYFISSEQGMMLQIILILNVIVICCICMKGEVVKMPYLASTISSAISVYSAFCDLRTINDFLISFVSFFLDGITVLIVCFLCFKIPKWFNILKSK